MDISNVLLVVGAVVSGSAISYFVLNSKKKATSSAVEAPVQEASKPAVVAAPVTVVAQPQPVAAVAPVAAPVDPENDPRVIQARAQAREIIIEAKDMALKLRTKAEDDSRRIKEEAIETEKRQALQKAQLENTTRELEQRTKVLRAAKEAIEKKQEEVEILHKRKQEDLEKIANLTKEEAKAQLLNSFDRELSQEKGKRIREMEEEIKHDSDKKAQEILVSAMRFGATDIVVEHATSRIKIPDEEIKGRIIGKEGRNIKAFEELTGVDLDLDSFPGEIMISSFDPVRREIAKLSMEKLIADGRIQPARIEEIVEKTRSETEHLMYKAGDDLCHKVGAYNVHKDLIQTLGRFKYRFSYGQNMLEHTLEESRIGIALAHELGVNVDVVRMGCLFHDIGKVVSDEEGTHIQLGVDLLRKYKVPEEIINCVAEHHEDRPFSSIESAIVNLSDHVSGTRPGARSEDYESYVTRLKELEGAALSFDGVDRAFAVSAGREVRVFVSPEKVDDYSTAYLAKEIAKKIELEQTYPGVVKVIVIRETRVTETAK